MRYVSKIIKNSEEVYILERHEMFDYIIVSDTDTLKSYTVNYDDKAILLNKSIYGVVLTGGKKYPVVDFIFMTQPYAMALYGVLEFRKVRSLGKTALQYMSASGRDLEDFINNQTIRGVYNGPTRALKNSQYTLFVTDSIMVTHSDMDYHNLASYLVFNKKYEEKEYSHNYTHVRYYDNYVEVKLFNSVYTYEILDENKFNNIITKAMCLFK